MELLNRTFVNYGLSDASFRYARTVLSRDLWPRKGPQGDRRREHTLCSRCWTLIPKRIRTHNKGDYKACQGKTPGAESASIAGNDAGTGQVLTLAYMNAESLRLTLKTGETWFWSRSRRELWHKGATSGNTQQVVEIRYDCDGDTLLVRVAPAGPACHTGKVSCFYRVL